MFHVKCVTCKNFDPSDGCKFNLEDESCRSYVKNESVEDAEIASCKNCVWLSNGFCDYDLDDPTTCRRFKSLKQDC